MARTEQWADRGWNPWPGRSPLSLVRTEVRPLFLSAALHPSLTQKEALRWENRIRDLVSTSFPPHEAGSSRCAPKTVSELRPCLLSFPGPPWAGRQAGTVACACPGSCFPGGGQVGRICPLIFFSASSALRKCNREQQDPSHGAQARPLSFCPPAEVVVTCRRRVAARGIGQRCRAREEFPFLSSP